jgi:hypothetical protein
VVGLLTDHGDTAGIVVVIEGAGAPYGLPFLAGSRWGCFATGCLQAGLGGYGSVHGAKEKDGADLGSGIWWWICIALYWRSRHENDVVDFHLPTPASDTCLDRF